jgi:hypothetical protein
LEIKYKDEIVTITSKENWEYKKINSKVLIDINSVMYYEIQAQVEKYIDNKEEIDKKEEEKKDKEIIEKQKKEVEIFKETCKEFLPLLEDYEIKYVSPNKYNFNAKKINFSLPNDYKDVEIVFNEFVYKGNWGRKERTNSKWTMTFDYKTRRYSTLEKAIKKGIEKIEEHKQEQDNKNNNERDERVAKQSIEHFAKNNGYEFCEKYHSRSNGRGNVLPGWTTYYMKKGNLRADLVYNNDMDTVVILNYTVTKEGISLKDLEKVI